MNSEVLIIGGGVIGLSIARELHKRVAGRITIVDRGTIGGEASYAAAGMLAPNIETDTSEDFHRFGTESLNLYPDFAAQLLAETGVDIELDRSGTLCLAFDENEAAELTETFRRQKVRNVPVEYLSGDAVRGLEPLVSKSAQAALLYSADWQVENRKLLSALRTFAERNGIRIVENVTVSELLADGSRVLGVKTAAGDMLADTTILATGAWTSLIKIGDASMPGSVKPIRGQMISFESGARQIGRVIYSPRGYLVPRADGRVLVGATVEDVGFDKSVTIEGIDSLRLAAAEIVPRLGDLEIGEKWAGLRPFAADGLPVLGEIPGYENAFVATAHFRNGILLAPKTAEIICDRILSNAASSYLELYGVGRFLSAANATVNW
jgi:glycine oxidase